MKKNIILLLLLIFIQVTCAEEVKKEKISDEHPFVALLKKNAETLGQDFDSTQQIKKENILSLLWSGKGILKRIKTKNKKKTIEVLTHPVNFTSMIDLYFIDKSGAYYYNYKKNRLKLLKKGNLIKKLKITKKLNFNANAYILVSLFPSQKKMFKGIDLLEERFNKDILDQVKSNFRGKLSVLRESALIEAGTVTNNIMLLASAYNLTHYPISLQSASKTLGKDLGIKKKLAEPFIIIPIGHKKKGSKSSFFTDYFTKLIKKGKNSLSKEFKTESAIHPDLLGYLLWAGNGFVKKQNKKFSNHSGIPVNLIELYYLNNKKVQRYDSVSDSLQTVKFGDYRHRLGRATRYKTRDILVIAIKTDETSIRKNKLRTGQPKKVINYYKKIMKNYSQLTNLALFQVGIALQNIRLLATDFQLAYQHIGIPTEKRARIADSLTLNKGDIPVFIIPLGNKKTQKKRKLKK